MKTSVFFACLSAFALLACTGPKKAAYLQKSSAGYGQVEQLADSFLHSLQQQNDVVLASAVENTAWGHSISYHILAQHNNKWAGYLYSIAVNKRVTINPFPVSKTAGDSVLGFFIEKQVWTIEGDKGRNFCDSTYGRKSCVLNDGATTHLLIVTPTSVIRPTYYEPLFYQRCCPNAMRQLFLQAVDKIQTASGGNGGANSSEM
jgi:hypothetical protein